MQVFNEQHLMRSIRAKVFITALYTTKGNATPIRNTCCHVNRSMMHQCSRTLSDDSLRQVHAMVDGLSECSTDVLLDADLTSRMVDMCSLLLCEVHHDKHRVTELTRQYLCAIQAVMQHETVNHAALVENLRTKFINPLLCNIVHPSHTREQKRPPPATSRQANRPTYRSRAHKQSTVPTSITSDPSGVAENKANLQVWESYNTFWTALEKDFGTARDGLMHMALDLEDWLHYPIHPDEIEFVNGATVQRFYTMVLRSLGPTDTLALLKRENLRWHPDKIEQKFHGCVSVDKVKILGNVITRQIIDVMERVKRDMERDEGGRWKVGTSTAHAGQFEERNSMWL